MNIVTPYPTNIPINTVNVTTESARRDNQLREMIAKPNATDAGIAERGVSPEKDKSKPQQPQQATPELESRQHNTNHPRIAERQGGQGENAQGDSGQQGQKDKEKEQAQQQLAKVQGELQRQDQQKVSQLKSRDAEVRTHEHAHASAGGHYAGSPTYEFKRGPDGKNYAVGGEVQIDTSPISGDPQATIQKMQQVRAAALAPAEPSGQDRKVASEAAQMISQARTEQATMQSKQTQEQQQPESAQDKSSGQSGDSQTQAADQSNQSGQANQSVGAGRSEAAEAFRALFGDDNDGDRDNTGSNGGVGSIFGATGAPGGGNRADVLAQRQAAQQRNTQQAADVVARANRIQSFYARSTVPREQGISQFA